MIPEHDLRSRQIRCPGCTKCDYADECAVCAAGKWGKHLFCPSWSPFKAVDGPGTKLTKKLKLLGFVHSPQCRCTDMAAKMDQWGPAVCRTRVEEILDVMQQASSLPESNPMRIPFVRALAKRLVLSCCREEKKVSA